MGGKRERVHIGVSRSMQAKLVDGADDAVNAFAKKLGLRNVNSARLKRFGVLSAEVEPEAAEKLRSEDDVDFVERDSEKKAI